MATAQEIHSFWEDSKAALAKVEMNPEVHLVESEDPFAREGAVKTRATFKVMMSSFEGQRIHAWYTVPAGEPPARGWPALLEVPGYAGVLPLPIHLALYGYAVLTLSPRGQGESVKEWQLDHGTKLIYNLNDRDTYYYRGAYMDCVRAVDYLSSREDVDSDRIGVWGYSQGGGLSLATAALDGRIKASVAGVPWLCSFPIAAKSNTPPYKELHDYLAEHPDEHSPVMSTLEYFDQMSLASEIGCPTIMCAAVGDEVHPLRTILPVFERIRSQKSIVVYPDNEHEFRSDFNNHGKAWMDRYLR